MAIEHDSNVEKQSNIDKYLYICLLCASLLIGCIQKKSKESEQNNVTNTEQIIIAPTSQEKIKGAAMTPQEIVTLLNSYISESNSLDEGFNKFEDTQIAEDIKDWCEEHAEHLEHLSSQLSYYIIHKQSEHPNYYYLKEAIRGSNNQMYSIGEASFVKTIDTKSLTSLVDFLSRIDYNFEHKKIPLLSTSNIRENTIGTKEHGYILIDQRHQEKSEVHVNEAWHVLMTQIYRQYNIDDLTKTSIKVNNNILNLDLNVLWRNINEAMSSGASLYEHPDQGSNLVLGSMVESMYVHNRFRKAIIEYSKGNINGAELMHILVPTLLNTDQRQGYGLSNILCLSLLIEKPQVFDHFLKAFGSAIDPQISLDSGNIFIKAQRTPSKTIDRKKLIDMLIQKMGGAEYVKEGYGNMSISVLNQALENMKE